MTTSHKKQAYRTEYVQGGHIYSSYVWATDARTAAWVLFIRGMDETLHGALQGPPPKTWVDIKDSAARKADIERMHYLMFLAFAALKAGNYGDTTVERVVGDKGWFHEYVHLLHGDEPLNADPEEVNSQIYVTEKLLGFTP